MNDALPKYLQAIGTFIIGLALLGGVGTYYASVRNEPLNQRTLAVNGKATRKIAPNQSVINGTWQEKGDSAEVARSKVEENSAKGVAAIKGAGIEDKYIQTTQVTVYPEYDYTVTARTPKITGYQASVTVEVTLTDTSKASAMIALLTQNGAAATSGPTLGISTEVLDQLKKDLRVAAVADAAGQAKALAEQAGANLGPVLSVTEGASATNPGIMPYDIASPAKDMDATRSSAEAGSSISIGEEEISLTVTVTYRLK